METRVSYLNISNKQYILIGITWGFIFASIFHYYSVFDAQANPIFLTFMNAAFVLKAIVGMIVGFVISYYGLRYLNK